MTGSVSTHTHYPNRVASAAQLHQGHDRSRQARHDGRRIVGRHGTRRVIAVVAVFVLVALAVLLLDAAGFDHRVAAASIAVLTGDVFASWFLIARASRGSSRRPTRAER